MGARYVLEKPIADKCSGTGLRGCSELTDGILLYVEGDRSGASRRIVSAAAANEPDDVRAFAERLRTISRLPGTESFSAPLKDVIDLLANAPADNPVARRAMTKRRGPVAMPSADEETEADVASRSNGQVANDAHRIVPAKHVVPKPPSDPPHPDAFDFTHWHTESTVPMVNVSGRPCAPGGAFTPFVDGTKGRCVRLLRGPLVVTDLHAPGGCSADMFVVGGNLSEPRWMMNVPANSALHVSNAVLLVGEHDYMVIGTMASSESKLKGDIRCSITWTAWKGGAAGELEVGY
jgi:hypothetical protein